MSVPSESKLRENRSYSVGARLFFRSLFRDGSEKQSRRNSQVITKLPSTEFFRTRSKSVDLGSTNRPSVREGKPHKSILYTVADKDTLTSVAARFDTTPSELTKLNKLVNPYIFTGQQLYVPLTETDENRSEGSTPVEDKHDDLSFVEKDVLENLHPVSPKSGHVERVRTPIYNQDLSVEQKQEPKSVPRERFLKINVRHITDGEGVVSGILLVTPNAVMFDPNVSDPLVIEKGPEAYSVIATMEFVVNAAIYNDIAHMRVGQMDSNITEKAEIYYPPDDKEPKSLGKDKTFLELVTSNDDADSVCSCTEREGDAFPKAFERDLVTPTNIDITEQGQSSLKERRQSLLDHHWPMMSRERQSSDVDEMPTISPLVCEDNIVDETHKINNSGIDERKASMPVGIEMPVREHYSDADIVLTEKCLPPVTIEPSYLSLGSDIESLGIDDGKASMPAVIEIPVREYYSDADIVLSKKWVPPVTIAPSHHSGSDIECLAKKKTSSVSFSLDSSSETENSTSSYATSLIDSKEDSKHLKSNKSKMLKRLSNPQIWMDTLGGEKDEENTCDHSPPIDVRRSSVFSKVFSRRSSIGTFIRQPTENNFKKKDASPVFSKVFSRRSSVGPSMRQPTENNFKKKDAPRRLDYRSMVSVDDKPDLFASLDKLIPRPARSCEDPPLYLRLKMGKPLNKKIPYSTPLMSYGKKKMQPEYWFSIPKSRVDELYKFLQAWFPHLYGELDEKKIKEKNFVLVDLETELWSDEPTPSDTRHDSQVEELAELTKESWEVLPMSEEYRQALHTTTDRPSLDIDLSPPDLVGKTEILTDSHRDSLCRHLPARAEGYDWTLVFSTSQHGFSLNSMYRKMYKLESPILLVIEDTENNVFGALTSCALRVSDHFYGTGESLLFRFTPHFQVYNWTGENLYFIKGNTESLSIGAGDGKFGLWLDDNLYLGRTECCKTYGNDPLTPKVDFYVKTLECWAFISSYPCSANTTAIVGSL